MKGVLAATVFMAFLGSAFPPTELFDYVWAHRGKALWQIENAGEAGGLEVLEVSLLSQLWRGTAWNHRLFLYFPKNPTVRDVVVLYISGDPNPGDSFLCATVSSLSGLPVALLHNVPFQPLFGLREDALIAHTFSKYLETKEPDWPLLFPMVRSVHAAMEALGAVFLEHWNIQVRGFILIGASKRGWTTYLAAATVPEKTLGIVPIVFDMVNIPLQMAHQERCYGGPSSMLMDYVQRGLWLGQGGAPEVARLLWLVDPYSYLYAYTMPKLVILGASDPYWTVDGVNFYWPSLPEPKLLLVVPNAGHNVLDFTRVVPTVIAFCRLVAQEKPLPKVGLEHRYREDGLWIKVSGDWPAERVSLWWAESPSRDFRAARWQETTLNAEERGLRLTPKPGYQAAFFEVVLEVEGFRMFLSTPPQVAGP